MLSQQMCLEFNEALEREAERIEALPPAGTRAKLSPLHAPYAEAKPLLFWNTLLRNGQLPTRGFAR